MTQHGSHPTDICSERETDVLGEFSSHFGNMNSAESVDLGRKPYGKINTLTKTDRGAGRAAGGH